LCYNQQVESNRSYSDHDHGSNSILVTLLCPWISPYSVYQLSEETTRKLGNEQLLSE